MSMTDPTARATSQPAGAEPKGQGEKNRYKSTLNLPKTGFPMKANLVQSEPESLKRWNEIGVYDRLRARKHEGGFVFHDGPPYANGSLHLGHLLNKCMKDFVVRSRSMMGLDCPYVPGWDCHGLPIEHRVMQDLAEKGKLEKLRSLAEGQRQMAVRRECRDHAEKAVKLQAEQLSRMMALGDYARPYRTMDPQTEGATLEVLAELAEQGLVYRALKPVHWSIENETALAEAELEYFEREDPSIYVDFEAADAGAVYDAFGLPPSEEAEDAPEPGAGVAPGQRPSQTPSFMIWTTTPWTLPANLAIAVHPDIEYALAFIDGVVTVTALKAVERIAALTKAERVEIIATAPGLKLAGLRYKHPFVEGPPAVEGPRVVLLEKVHTIVCASYVTLEDGTGLVHTAPGHGVDDYNTGIAEGLPIYCPVKGDGRYDHRVPEFLRGRSVWEANKLVVERLRASGHMFHDHLFTHSYPHDWRSKTPTIFRCTEQWFVGVDHPNKRGETLRELALRVTAEQVQFVPDWGRNRMRGMLESRPDWCISRQRAWGLPIPAFFFETGGRERTLMTPATIRAVAKVVREKGADAWFQLSPAELLSGYDPAADPDKPSDFDPGATASLRKGGDILDVWFESGSTWHSVMRERGLGFPVDLYLEGSDQHRGWFQLSLLTCLGLTGRAPFKALVTHGFMLGREGLKLSKSKGDTLEALFKDYGVDVLRWWVSSLSYEHDMKVDREFFDLAGQSYFKVRNTLRFLLSNLDDFSPPGPGEAASAARSFPPTSIEAWALSEFEALRHQAVAAYERFDFRIVHEGVYNFCNAAMSAEYLAAVKDRLYCDAPDSPRRRRTQTAMWIIADGLCRILAPIMPHTADEAFRALWKTAPDDRTRCVHLEHFPAPCGVVADARWSTVRELLRQARPKLEHAKGSMGVENPLDAAVVLPDPEGALKDFAPEDLADLLGVSRVSTGGGEVVVQDLRGEARCERSWKRDGTVRQRSDGGLLSERDARALGVA